MADPIASYKDWRVGLPPQWYPTHSNAYYVGVTGGSFTEVSCLGMPSVTMAAARQQPVPEPVWHRDRVVPHQRRRHVADGGQLGHAGLRRRDGPDPRAEGIVLRQVRGIGDEPSGIARPPLPPGVEAGGHGGSHGHLMNEFVTSILADRKPLVDIAQALNMTVAGIVAHQSALKDGETLKILSILWVDGYSGLIGTFGQVAISANRFSSTSACGVSVIDARIRAGSSPASRNLSASRSVYACMASCGNSGWNCTPHVVSPMRYA